MSVWLFWFCKKHKVGKISYNSVIFGPNWLIFFVVMVDGPKSSFFNTQGVGKISHNSVFFGPNWLKFFVVMADGPKITSTELNS